MERAYLPPARSWQPLVELALEEERADLERQLELLEAEADQAHVPMVWRH